MNPLNHTDSMQINRLTLAFCGRHAHLEGPFQEDQFRTYLRPLRIGILFAIFVFGGFGLYDAFLLPQKTVWFWTIRWAIVCPIFLLAFLFTFSRHFQRLLVPVMVGLIAICGLGLFVLILVAQTEACYTYTNGMVQLLFFLHVFLKIRFIWRAPITWFLIAAYVGLAIGTGITPRNILIADVFNLSCINAIGMMAAYILELRSRRNFFLARQLESKKRRLSLANQFLEERVTKRTRELSRTNQLLKDEIQDRKAAETALRESEKRFRRMVDNVSDYMCVHDLNGNILDANRQMSAGLGFSHSELIALNFKTLLAPEQRCDFEHYLNNIRREGRAVGKMTLLTRDGQRHQIEYSNVLADYGASKRVVYGLSRDQTQHQRTEKALAESQANFATIFEIAAAGIMIVNARTRKIVEVNPAAADMVGIKIDQIIGMRIDALIVEPDQNKQDAFDGVSTHPIECELLTHQQNHIPILKSTKGTALNGEAHWIVSFVNIQQIKEAEAAKRTMEKQLNQAQHLQAIGTLAGGIAHDFNNILFGMMGFAEMALDDAIQNSVQASNLNEILQGGRRAKEMINQILTFSRHDQADRHPLQPAPLIKEALKLLRASIPTSIVIQSNLNDDVGMVDANATQIHQVLMNLCTNAAHAMPSGVGKLSIELEKETLDQEEVTARGKISMGNYVRISVIDNGMGMPSDVIDHIFEPFFTTKPQGKGTGMGLSVALGIVQSHGGAMRVQSQTQKGSRFDILLPILPTPEKSSVQANAALPTGKESILFAEEG